MARKRTGIVGPDGPADDDHDDHDDEVLPPEVDPLATEAGTDDWRPEPVIPVPAGSLKIQMKCQWREGDEWKPPGVYVMPREQALHYVKTGAAEVKA